MLEKCSGRCKQLVKHHKVDRSVACGRHATAAGDIVVEAPAALQLLSCYPPCDKHLGVVAAIFLVKISESNEPWLRNLC